MGQALPKVWEIIELIGTVINYRYEILEKCGDGNFFSVYKSRDKVLNRLVAVKVLNPEYSRDRDFAERLISESQMTEDLDHPNIAKVFDADEQDGAYFLAVEYVRGINLKDRIKRTAPFAVSYAIDIAIAVAQALDEAHKKGIIHGDVRPHNIITSPEGQIKLTDFGVARALSGYPEIREATMMRTVHYMSPEVVRGDVPTASSDIYSLGVILYEMLTGSVPYDGPTSAAVVARQLQDPVPSPQLHNSGIPTSLNDIVVKAMQKDPAHRFQSAGELAAALTKIRDWLRTGVMHGTATKIQPKQDEEYEETFERSENTLKNLAIAFGVVLAIAVLVSIIVVKLFPGTGSDMLPVPDLVGKTLDQARTIADQSGLQVEDYREEYNDKYPAGQIWMTNPAPGGSVPKSSPTIKVWISKGPRLKSVPDVTGLSLDDARKKVLDAGFLLGSTPESQYSDTVPVDHVISQSPSAGDQLEPLKQVTVVLSRGQNPDTATTEPDSSTQPPDTGTDNTGDSSTSTDNNSNTEPAAREFKINASVPSDADGPQDVRIEVSDAYGDTVPHEDTYQPGERVSKTVMGYGDHVQIKVYIGDKLIRDVVYRGDKVIRNRSY